MPDSDQNNDDTLFEEVIEDEEQDGSASWLMTFGDMMTLLLAFFVLLFAMSETQMEDFAQLMESLKKAIGKQEVPEAGTRVGLKMMEIKAEEQPKAVDELGALVKKEMEDFESQTEEFILANTLAGQVKVEEDGRGAVITISDLILFPSGEADFLTDAEDVLLKIKELINQFKYHVKVEGHTDNVPINTPEFPSNWELSANRASKIVRFFIEQGVDPDRLSAEGFAEYRPIEDNSTIEGRAKNRRVEIVYQRADVTRAIQDSLNQVDNTNPIEKLPTSTSRDSTRAP
ncbi:MAG: OmpA family protein [Candidatus Marinimicrobia bacterium]|nr:OmpA family protein [Candidatus Neomarinimicrobiota bacterium]MCF7841119.1 OmpA family protein [Candidatus Neomarinimicrobiota bacterium]MCF7901791.1 OmpA family protein [Candidatus Neomarinimicrobiota bacterium]